MDYNLYNRFYENKLKKMSAKSIFNSMKIFLIIAIILFCTIGYIVMKQTDPNPREATKIPSSCKIECNSPFNKLIGQFNQVRAFSNCNSDCTNDEDEGAYIEANQLEGLKSRIYTGMRWQCVEFSRRYLIISKGITYGSINHAYEIFDLNYAIDIRTNERKNFKGFLNDGLEIPKKDDLIIFAKDPKNVHGHVAVALNVVLINENEGFVEIGEQNYYNKKWEEFNFYARRLLLERNKETKKWKLYDRSMLNQEKTEDELNIIGWKRVDN